MSDLWRAGAADQPPRLHASRCRACGLVAFPVERYGCERCGALPADHESIEVTASGRVRAFARVHRHHQPDPPAPFVVVQVDVPEGPSLKGLLAGGEVAVGDRVVGEIADGDRFRWAVAG